LPACVGAARIRDPASGGYIESTEPIVLFGESGTGKIHLATALCVAACRQLRRAWFITAANLRALKLLRPGGVLVTCSCSHHLHESHFLEVIAAAAADSRRTVTLLERRSQAPDHPVLLGAPETAYLKCLILAVH